MTFEPLDRLESGGGRAAVIRLASKTEGIQCHEPHDVDFCKEQRPPDATLLLTGTRASGKVIGANDRLRIAVAGLNGRGKSHIQGWLGQDNVEIAYVIDPDRDVLNSTLGALEAKDRGAVSIAVA